MMTDPIADMLNRVRNAYGKGCETVDLPASALKLGIAQVLKREGYITDVARYEDGWHGRLRIYLKYGPRGEKVILGLKRVSTPGRRVYARVEALPRVQSGLGVAVVSTPQGVLSDRECRQRRVGGEVLCAVW